MLITLHTEKERMVNLLGDIRLHGMGCKATYTERETVHLTARQGLSLWMKFYIVSIHIKAGEQYFTCCAVYHDVQGGSSF